MRVVSRHVVRYEGERGKTAGWYQDVVAREATSGTAGGAEARKDGQISGRNAAHRTSQDAKEKATVRARYEFAG